METKSFDVPNVLACSANADKMRKEIDTVTGLLIGLIGRNEKHKCVVSVTPDGEWSLYQNGATCARYIASDKKTIYEIGLCGPHLSVQNVAQVRAALPHFISGMIARFDGPNSVLTRRLTELKETQ